MKQYGLKLGQAERPKDCLYFEQSEDYAILKAVEIPEGWEAFETGEEMFKYIDENVKSFDEIVETLIQVATASGLGDFIQQYFFDQRVIIMSKDKGQLRKLFEETQEEKLLTVPEGGKLTPQQYALSLLTS